MLTSKALEGFLLDYSIGHARATTRLRGLYLNLFVKWSGDLEISKITPEILRLWFQYLAHDYSPKRPLSSTRVGDPLSAVARDNHYKGIKVFFQWLFDNKLIGSNPAKSLPRPKVPDNRPDPFTVGEIKRLLISCQEIVDKNGIHRRRPTAKRNMALILLLLDTGVRLGELSRLQMADVRLDTREILVNAYDTGLKSRSRVIPISPRTANALWIYLNAGINRPGSQVLFDLNTRSVHKLLLQLGKSAGVPNTRAHRFRHTFAIQYLRNNGDVFSLQRILGHNSLDMVNRYLKLAQTDLQSAHNRASPVDNWKL